MKRIILFIISFIFIYCNYFTVLNAAPFLTADYLKNPEKSLPSPYFVHDAEVFFYDLFARTMKADNVCKFGLFYVNDRYKHIYNIVTEVPLFIPEKNEIYTKSSEMRKKKSYMSITFGMGQQYVYDGNPDNKDQSAVQNRLTMTLIGAAYYSRQFFIKLNYVYSMYGLKEEIYDPEQNAYVDVTGYFNYSSKNWKDDNGKGNPLMKLLGNFTLGDTFSRIFLDGGIDIDVLGLTISEKIALNLLGRPSYSLTMFDLNFGRYQFTPYYSWSEDVEGDNYFGTTQVGLHQRLYFSRRDVLGHIRFNVNFTKNNFERKIFMTKSDFTNSEKKDYYYEAEIVLFVFSLSAWYNKNIGYGYGIGYNLSSRRYGNYTIKGKYNSYASQPVFNRYLSHDRWGFEWAAILNFYSFMSGWF